MTVLPLLNNIWKRQRRARTDATPGNDFNVFRISPEKLNADDSKILRVI